MNYISKYDLPSLPAGAEFEPKDEVYYQSIQKGSCKCHLYFKKAVIEWSGWFTQKEKSVGVFHVIDKNNG